MALKDSCQFSIREYRPSDKSAVVWLLQDGILEHVYPAFFKAMSHPDHVGITLSISMAGYVLGGSSYLQALLFGGAWAGLIYYCCQEIYQGFLTRRLEADMADIQATYLEKPGNGLWVAEAEVRGQAKVVGMVAVLGKEADQDEGQRVGDCNGGVVGGARGPEFDPGAGNGCYGEVSHMAVGFGWRRRSVGSQLAQRALEFCKERGYAHLALNLSSPQTAAAALTRKLGFVQTASHTHTHANRWFSKLARITAVRMEKITS
ncbi:N-acetyltransferase family 8 member 3 [Takifugu rubripes]|uniref:N-acetyltransferase family 8 member 3 n=1 Tax=Takifugu rubripes TaxID=31033 RepID=UPI0011456787|nr:N-acetyltransferase family 8 member 3-like [Takifugu rubripes]